MAPQQPRPLREEKRLNKSQNKNTLEWKDWLAQRNCSWVGKELREGDRDKIYEDLIVFAQDIEELDSSKEVASLSAAELKQIKSYVTFQTNELNIPPKLLHYYED